MPDRLPSDETRLVRLAASCDESAFCELIDRFDRCITSVVNRYASRPVDREDLRSEIVAKLLVRKKRALRTWKPTASFASYLSTIAARHCMDWLRRRGSLPRARLTGESGGSPDILLEEVIAAGDGANPHHCIEAGHRRETICQAFDQLSSSDRLVLYLRFDQELSGGEIAGLLGITHGAARQRLFRAISRLEDQMRRFCPELMSPDEH
ncbi:MAG: sigma-70 family RNA polymerase sigma factor [Armatimonadota bacterium]